MESKKFITARELMQDLIVVLRVSTTLSEARDLFQLHKVSGAPVINEQGALVGVVSNNDIVRTSYESADLILEPDDVFFSVSTPRPPDNATLARTTVGEIISGNVVRVTPDDPITHVAKLMLDSHIHRVIVVADSQPVGIITTFDMLRLIAETA